MARKKNIEEITADLENRFVEGNSEEQVVIEEPTDDNKEEQELIPEFADKVLKIHYSYPELYVDCLGGAYVPGTQPESATNAILCKNPYYKQ